MSVFLVHNPVPNGLCVHNCCFEKLCIFSLFPRPLPDFPPRLQDKIWDEANMYSLNTVTYFCLQKPTMLTLYLLFGMWVLNRSDMNPPKVHVQWCEAPLVCFISKCIFLNRDKISSATLVMCRVQRLFRLIHNLFNFDCIMVFSA